MLGRDGMVKGSDGETCCRLLLLEAIPGSLAEVRLAWPSAEVFKRALSETQGVADQISREKIQIVFSDLSWAGCSALNVLSQIRRVHPQLPLVAILPEEDFSLGLSALRTGADNVLVHPLDKDALLACRENLQSREHLLTGMLRLFSLDSGSENWDWQVISLPETLSRGLENHDIRIQEINLDLHVDFPEDLLPVWADQDKLVLLFDGLVDNAVKFNRQGGRLSVTAGNLTLHGEPALYLQISNQGKIVPRESAEDIFQEYSQLGELDAGKPSGIGVGIATCRAILLQMQGVFLNLKMRKGLQSVFFCQPEWS
jgi:signal transduction histidine kinase